MLHTRPVAKQASKGGWVTTQRGHKYQRHHRSPPLFSYPLLVSFLYMLSVFPLVIGPTFTGWGLTGDVWQADCAQVPLILGISFTNGVFYLALWLILSTAIWLIIPRSLSVYFFPDPATCFRTCLSLVFSARRNMGIYKTNIAVLLCRF